MATAPDRKVRNLSIGRWKSRWKVASIFANGFGHYVTGLWGRHGRHNVATHAASQMMVFDPKLRRLFGMTTLTERAYLYWYGKHIFSGKGQIVDLGCWLGSTTIALAMGVEQNRLAPFKTSIYGYDEFIWRAYMDSGAKGTELDGKYKVGDSFVDEFERRTSQWQSLVKACPGDLAKVGWGGEAIEFLLVDAMKSWEAATGVVQSFFPALIPGVSILLHQDFAHWFTAWIHPIHYRFREYFEPVYDVPSSGSMVFRLIRELPLNLLRQEWSAAQFSDQEVEAAFAYSLEIVNSEKRANILAAKAMYFLHSGRLDQAQNEIAAAHSRGYSFDSDLAIAERRIVEAVANASESLSKRPSETFRPERS